MIKAGILRGFLLQQEEADKRSVGKGCSISETVLFRVFFKQVQSHEGVTLWFAWPFAFHSVCRSGEPRINRQLYILVVKLGASCCLTRAERTAGE